MRPWITTRDPINPSVARLEQSSDGTVMVRIAQRQLSAESLQALVAGCHATQPAARGLVFDFSQVRELVCPWTLHFAMLIDLARQRPQGVGVRGLHGQPLDVARLFWQNPEIRALVEEDGADGSPR